MTTVRPLAILCLLTTFVAAAPVHAEAACSQTIQGPDAPVDVRCEAPGVFHACVQLLVPDGNDSTWLFLVNATPGLTSNPSC